MLLPPPDLRARLDERVFSLSAAPDVAIAHPHPDRHGPCDTRRGFLRAAAGLLALGTTAQSFAGPLVFSTEAEADRDAARRAADGRAQLIVNGRQREKPVAAPPGPQLVTNGREPEHAAMERLALGEIPDDFWERPRELHLQRQGTKERMRVVYWKDGRLVPEGYWSACNLMRDVKANMMTYMDPAMLDILRGIVGYYEAWNWNYPIIITSGYRTVKTNNRLASEGAAKNSMHLYGRAADLYMQNIPVAHLAQLGKHFQRGGVGFYPRKGFVHLDTGRLRSWKG